MTLVTKFRNINREAMALVKNKRGRFDGLTEEQVKQKDALPDYLQPDLDIVFVGINPSLMAAHKGRYYAGPGNHFYKLLHAAELVPRFVSFEEDHQLLKYKIGLTNIVDRASRSSADLSKAEIKNGCRIVRQKIIDFEPKIAVFNGKCIYEVYAEQMGKKKFDFGLQNEKIGNTVVWVVPSSSARCSNFPRLDDKLPFFVAIKKHLQFLKGEIKNVNINEFYFASKVKDSSTQKRKKIDDINTNIYPKYVVTEILDGTQLNCEKKEVDDEKNSSQDDEKSGELSKVNKSSHESESKKPKKLCFANIDRNRGTFHISEVT